MPSSPAGCAPRPFLTRASSCKAPGSPWPQAPCWSRRRDADDGYGTHRHTHRGRRSAGDAHGGRTPDDPAVRDGMEGGPRGARHDDQETLGKLPAAATMQAALVDLLRREIESFAA